MHHLNASHPSIKYTSEISGVPFLDIKTVIVHDHIVTDLYILQTHRYPQLPHVHIMPLIPM